MTVRFVGSLCALALAGVLAGTGVRASRQGGGGDAVAQFHTSVNAYMRLHEAIAANAPPLAISRDVSAIQQAVRARREALQRARQGVGQGDLFTPAVSQLFRERIAAALREHGLVAADFRDEEGEEAGTPLEPPSVNHVFAWATAATPPCVLAALPTLPDGLQYRFVGTSLVLVDIDASLIVDVLPDVLDATP